MQPIHYSFLLGILSIVGGFIIALYQMNPLAFVFSVVVAYLLGGQTVGRFGRDDDRDDDPRGYPRDYPRDYRGTKAGFTPDP